MTIESTDDSQTPRVDEADTESTTADAQNPTDIDAEAEASPETDSEAGEAPVAAAAEGPVGTADEEEESQPTQAAPPPRDVPADVGYRLAVYYHARRRQYGVHCEELGDLEVFGETREAALHEGEAMLESKIAGYAARGEPLPKPFGLEREEDYTGHLELEVSKSLHRDIALQARRDRVSVERLAVELLAAGLASRRSSGRRGREEAPRGRPGGDRDRDRNDSRGRGRRGMSAERYHQVMEDKGAFLEYVRGLDGPGGGGARGGRGGRGRRGR